MTDKDIVMTIIALVEWLLVRLCSVPFDLTLHDDIWCEEDMK